MISCKEYVQKRKSELQRELLTFSKKPQLVVIQIDNDPASDSYIKGKKNDCVELGVQFMHLHIDSKIHDQKYLEKCIRSFAANKAINGIIIQLPIPDKYDLNSLLNCIPKEKDVDGFRKDSCFNPCTPNGIIHWLKYNKYDFVGKDAVVLGRSEIVGKPLTNMLINEGATVTCCNSHSDLSLYLPYADIVFSAIGKSKYINSNSFDCFENDTRQKVIVDIGINRDKSGKLCGDVNSEDIKNNLPNVYVTPVPNGVGLLTRLALLENVIEAYKLQHSL